MRLALFLLVMLGLPLTAAYVKSSPWHWSYGIELPGMTHNFQEIRCVYPLGVQFCGWR